jgi:DNA repair protein RadC
MQQNSLRPRERAALEGVAALSDAELLALVLGTGRKGEPAHLLSAAILEEAGGVRGLTKVGLGLLTSRAGVGPAKGARVAAAIELGRRATTLAVPARMSSAADVADWARARIVSLDHEELWILALDGASRLRAARRVAMGGLHGVHVTTRDPLRVALREGASAFVLVHNHPSGDPTPSADDIDFTDRIGQAAELVGTPLVDHVVVARDGWRSIGGMQESHAARGRTARAGSMRAIRARAGDQAGSPG